jgi:segregation and condensation protein B
MPDEELQKDEAVDAEGEGMGDGEEAEVAVGPDSRLLIEGLLFSAGKPLRVVDIEEATSLDRRKVMSTLRKLASDYRRRNTALEIVKVGSRWTMQVRTEFTHHARAVATPEVSSRLLRTLALIAYHQPVLQSDLQEMLGPKVYDHVRELVGLGLVNAARKGSTKQLTTTQRFPEYFGIASAKRDDIKRFLAERVGVAPPEPPAASSPETSDEGQSEAVAEGPAVDDQTEPSGPEEDQG